MALFDFHLLKLEHALIFQVIDQNIYTPVFENFTSSNGWRVYCDDMHLPSIEDGSKEIYLRHIDDIVLEDLYHTPIIMFDDNSERDKIYDEVMLALEEWALNARKINEI